MEGSEDSSGNWLMTYADFITLMMIFFIVLYTLTPGVEKAKFEAVIGAFKGSTGVLNYRSVTQNEIPQVDLERARTWDSFHRYIEEQDLDDDVEVEMLPSGVLITLGEAVTFDSYSAELVDESLTIMRRIISTIEGYTLEEIREIEIQGHTDDRPVGAGAVLYRDNWELGAARATSVLKFLVDNSKIDPAHFKASTLSQYHPRTSNETAEGQRQNRRVTLFVQYRESGDDPPDRTLEDLKEEVVQNGY